MYGEPKHKENCLPSTSKFANCKGDHISTDKNCLIYRKEYKMKHEHLMAFENLAMSDARKLVHKNPIKIINSGIENFSILKEKLFTPFNEVVKEQKHICINTKERLQNKSVNSNSTSNHFYKIQSENYEDFIGPREYLPSSDGLTIKRNSPKPDVHEI